MEFSLPARVEIAAIWPVFFRNSRREVGGLEVGFVGDGFIGDDPMIKVNEILSRKMSFWVSSGDL